MAIASPLLYFLLSTGLVGNVESSTDLNPMDIFVLIDSNICPPREHLDRCHAHCQRNCTNFHLDTPCPDVCVKGCVCDEGFARDLAGTCVRLYDCLRSEDECPSGEHYDQCSGHCERNCTTATPDCSGYCIPGCVCDEGTVRGANGKCIPSSQCDAFFPEMQNRNVSDEKDDTSDEDYVILPGLVQCPMREHYSECHAHCQKNCTNLRQPFKCPSDCVGGCVCDTGLVRGVDGKCVRRDECPVIDRCPKGEHYEQCDAACERNCTNWIHPILPCSETCVPGCVCNKGTVRGPDGQCIKPIKCSKAALRVQELPSCGLNEQFSGCKAMCQKNCTNWDKFVPCPRICVPGCVCQEGFVRGPEGHCILPEQCSYASQEEVLESDRRSCGVNEEYSDCAMRNCQEDCSGWYKFMPCPPFCLGGCVCITGTIRGPNGNCIPRNECPPDSQRRFFEIAPPSCPRNEEYALCDGNCQRTCENKDQERDCPIECLGGCVCKGGLFRRPDGQCVPPGSCPAREETTTGYPGEVITWDSNEYTTGDYDSAMSSYATEEFITTEEPQRFVFFGASCPRNEEYTLCNGNCQKTCENKDDERVCLPECHGGCICKEGLFRAPNGKCVAPEKCPTQKTTAEYLAAVHEDYAYTTEDYASTMSFYETEEFRTTDEPEVTTFDLKNSVSQEEDSPRECPPGQHYSPCHAHCQRSCHNYDVRFVCPNLCQAGCVCDRGLVKDDGGRCVKPHACPGRRTSNIHRPGSSCPSGEQFSRCKAHCEKTCDNYEHDLMCTSVCISGCTCGSGQVRNRDGQCVHTTKCPKSM